MLLRLKKKYSIKKNEDIQVILNTGFFHKSKYFIIYIRKNAILKNYVAFLAGKKLGNAPIRNRIKRKMRQSLQVCWPNLGKGYDIVIIARYCVLQEKNEILVKDLENLLKKHRIIHKVNK